MIPNEILDRLVPNGTPDMQLRPGLGAVLQDNPTLLKLALWSAFVRQRVRILLGDQREFNLAGLPLSPYDALGIGLFPAPTDQIGNEVFPRADGWCFGLSIYRAMNGNSQERERAQPLELDLRFQDFRLPVVVLPSDVIEHQKYWSEGQAAALVRKADGEYCLLTARHVVAGLPNGDLTYVDCLGDMECEVMVESKATGCIDAALLRPVTFPGCFPSYSVPSTQGLPVQGHFASQPGPLSMTITQIVETPQGIISAVQPHNFLLDGNGQPGDSGAAISWMDPVKGISPVVGMYLGVNSVRLPDGTMSWMGYALEMDQILEILGVELIGGFFK